jgi:hypothetical protein
MITKKYYYKGKELFNVREVKGLNYLGFDLEAEYKDKPSLGDIRKPDENGEIIKFGKFYLKDLEIL